MFDFRSRAHAPLPLSLQRIHFHRPRTNSYTERRVRKLAPSGDCCQVPGARGGMDLIDVAVVGAGLGGLSAARDLARAGADVVVLEARDRPGGRVEQVTLPDGRTVQAGGEVFGPGHHAYRELVEELGLTIEESYVADPGEMTWGLLEGVHVGDEPPWMSAEELADAERVDARVRAAGGDGRSRRPVVAPRRRRARPAQPRRLAALRGGAARGAPAPRAGVAVAVLRLAGTHVAAVGSAQARRARRRSFLRPRPVGGAASRPRARRRSRCGWPPSWARASATRRSCGGSRSRPGRVRVTLADGELIEAEAVVCAIPAGPLREVADQRRQRRAAALAGRPAPRAGGQGRGRLRRAVLAGATARTGWPRPSGCSARPGRRAPGVLSMLVPPERFSAFVAAPRRRAPGGDLDGLVALYGERGAAARRRCSSVPGAQTRSPAATSRAGRRGTWAGSGRCTAPTSRRSTWRGRTTGWPATWRARCRTRPLGGRGRRWGSRLPV